MILNILIFFSRTVITDFDFNKISKLYQIFAIKTKQENNQYSILLHVFYFVYSNSLYTENTQTYF